MRSIVRRRRKKIEWIHDYELSDGKVRIKIIAVTARVCYRSQMLDIRNKMSEELDNLTKNKTKDELVKELLERKLQEHIKEVLQKIFPIANVEVRKLEILN